jgi:acetyltransferase
MSYHYLHPLFNPRAVAVFGASERENSVAGQIVRNLIEGDFAGAIHPVNPKHEQMFGRKCYPATFALPSHIDLAIIATPAATVPGLIREIGDHGIRNAIVLSAGFREVGPEGIALEHDICKAAKMHRVRFIGPNCLGMQRPGLKLNATFGPPTAKAGDLALVSQSGAVCTAVLDWAEANDVGFSSIVSMGAGADLDFGEILDFLAVDPATKSILLYVEGIRDARRFMSALRLAAAVKPVIVIKVGRHPAGVRAAQSHTGALVGSDGVFTAMMRRAGVVRVETIVELISAAQALSRHVHPQGRRLAIVTNGGGPGVMATDRAADLGMSLPDLTAETVAALNTALPAAWSHGNPVDVLGDAGADRYKIAVNACLSDPNVDGVLVMLTPQAMTKPLEAAEAVIDAAKHAKKPVLTAWLGEKLMVAARNRFRIAGVPTYDSPEGAVEAFGHLSTYYENQRLLRQSAGPLADMDPPDTEGARLIIEAALSEGRTVLSETESKALLAAFHIPVATALIARSPSEALLMAEQLGFPVVLKINSPDISHKSDVGGVRLNLDSGQAVRAAYAEMMTKIGKACPSARLDGVVIEPMTTRPHVRELLIGIASDPVLGPVITFGAGGVAVEVFKDSALALPPLNRYLARDLMERTKVFKMLGAFRNLPPAALGDIENVLLRVSEMACELPWLKELDINPLMVNETGVSAVDARIVVARQPPLRARYAHMAIHPYPADLVETWQQGDGQTLTIRPIRAEDADMTQRFVRELSAQSKFYRFMSHVQELNPDVLARLTQIDYGREMAFVATVPDADTAGAGEIEVAVARYSTLPDGQSCEFALVVSDDWQHRGIGFKMMTVLLEHARSRGLAFMEGEVLADNSGMLTLMTELGFSQSTHPEDPAIKRVVRDL